MDPKNSVILRAQIARRIPAPPDAPAELSSVETHIFRVKASEVPPGIPDDANPREPNLNRQVYRRVRASLAGEEGEGAFHLKHGGIVLVAEKVERLRDQPDRYRLWFNPAVKQGITNGNHSYQYVEIKVHTGVPPEVVPDLAEGLNTSMQVREESLADLRNQFEWLKRSLGRRGESHVSWHEGDEGEYDVREVIALLMALDPTRYRLEDPVGIENTYARLSSVFRSYLADPARVERFGPIALQALELYEYIRYSATKLWQGRFRRTVIADTKKNSLFAFPFLPPENETPRASDARLTKAAAIPCFAAFRALVEVPDEGEVTWRYDFQSIKSMWDEYGAEVMREVHDAVTKQYNGNTHYAGRSVMLYRATTKTLELADLRRRVASDG